MYDYKIEAAYALGQPVYFCSSDSCVNLVDLNPIERNIALPERYVQSSQVCSGVSQRKTWAFRDSDMRSVSVPSMANIKVFRIYSALEI